jgi:hypothetical protein
MSRSATQCTVCRRRPFLGGLGFSGSTPLGQKPSAEEAVVGSGWSGWST